MHYPLYLGADGDIEWHGWREVPVVAVHDGPLLSKPFELAMPAHFYSRVVGRWIDIPAGHSTDFFSIPRPFRWYFQVVGQGRTAALLHDWLVDSRPAWTSNVTATDIFVEALELAGVGAARVDVFGWAVLNYGPRWEKQYPYK